MSSSKSDVVTHSVCLSIRNQGVARVFQESFKDVSTKIKGNFREVSEVFFKDDSRKIGGCFNGVLIGLQGCLKKVEWVFQGCSKKVFKG